jgi:hypothetical protein
VGWSKVRLHKFAFSFQIQAKSHLKAAGQSRSPLNSETNMITFTPLAGSARSDSALPLAYILEIDDVKVLLDCGSPDWHPDDDIKAGNEALAAREEYCAQLQRSSVISTPNPSSLTITRSTHEHCTL